MLINLLADTGEKVAMRCPCCEAFVSEAAFHKKDLLTTFIVGEGVLGWSKAHKALKMVCSDFACGHHFGFAFQTALTSMRVQAMPGTLLCIM